MMALKTTICLVGKRHLQRTVKKIVGAVCRIVDTLSPSFRVTMNNVSGAGFRTEPV